MALPGYAEFFREAAAVAAREGLPRFRTGVSVDNKLDAGFDPVTEADRAIERAIRDLIGKAYPGHGILGEEEGAEGLDREHVWVLDPIDGTRAFISGLPVWGTLLGLTRDGDAVAGMMAQPFTGELYYGDATGAHYEGPGGARQLKTRPTGSLGEATLFTTSPALYAGDKRRGYDRLEAAIRLPRYGTDCYAFAMVAAGHADFACECGLKPYDIVGLIPIIEQAGGIVTRWDGGPAETGGDILASGNPALHEQALALLNGA
ncbi:histidinol-phosphatase [Zhengella mangrovi]|uniref:Histidinol-phosphatase n=1 Tax=Zhengella mangrovi TaxID=1982044 RepID=A0A2G1QNX8_9HYPH|nr:histidinol-phosphatase [Zhengella mangrovi]PHP67223.1 histidinol-phosphatase [Zhengella mangrovi]